MELFLLVKLRKRGKILVIDKRTNVNGNIYIEKVEGINFSIYGAHTFHTNREKNWKYVNQFAMFNCFVNSQVANYEGELYSLPFNMYTSNKKSGVITLKEALTKIEEQRREIKGESKNLEELASSLVGCDIYEKLIKGYIKKKLGRDCKDLPLFIIKRLPFDNYYFNALYQGNAGVNYTDTETPWNRITEHKWFEFGKNEEGNDLSKTIISKEYSSELMLRDEPYAPVNDEKNGVLYQQYKELISKVEKIIFGGRSGEYKHYDMDTVILFSLCLCDEEL